MKIYEVLTVRRFNTDKNAFPSDHFAEIEVFNTDNTKKGFIVRATAADLAEIKKLFDEGTALVEAYNSTKE